MVFWEGAGVQYEEVFEGVLKNSNQKYSVQGFMHAYWEEIGRNTFDTVKMESIKERIAETGYHFCVMDGDQIYFSNLNEVDKKAFEEYGLDPLKDRAGSFMFEAQDGTVLIIDRPYRQDWDITGIAIRLPSVDKQVNPHDGDLMYTVTEYITIAFCLVIIVIVGSNLFYVAWMKKNLFTPLEKLAKGASYIGKGNYEVEIQNEKEDEIGEVCREFNRMRIQLKEAEDNRSKFEAYKAEILAGISHDIRSPLTSIIGYTEGIQQGIADTEEKREKYCRAILTRARDMERLANTLGNYMMLKSGKMEFHRKKIQVNEFIQNYVADNQMTDFEEWKITFQLSLQDEPMKVLLDSEQMIRVFNNLVQNAVKYRVKEESVIEIRTKMQENQVCITIKDDGPGVAEEELQEIFTSFYRGDKARTQSGKGSGLGLSIVKEIVEEHQGTIEAQNENGLAIIIRLPLIHDNENVKERAFSYQSK